jgi:acyl-CoA synthetase (AMP-forming)/AMP-acid ligase II
VAGQTWQSVLSHWIETDPDAVLYRFLPDGERVGEELTRLGLHERARGVAARLRQSGLRPGDRALLLFAPGLDFIVAFFGCIYAGVVSVPLYLPASGRSLEPIERIAAHSGALALLTSEALAGSVCRGSVVLDRLRVVLADAGAPPCVSEPLFPARPHDVVMLQYTSGSTGVPKGVALDHANMLHNEALIARAFAHDVSTIVLGWLPLYHDMGLIGNVLQPVFVGGSCVLMAPERFLERPMRWLEAISRYRATTSGGPDFAFALCVRHHAPALQLDLSCWRVAFDGAEPVRADTLTSGATASGPRRCCPATASPRPRCW